MDKLDLILEKLKEHDGKFNKIDADLSALKSDNKEINKKLDLLTKTVDAIGVAVLEHKKVLAK